MPLRDHFRPPLTNTASWEGFHGQWPANIVQQLRKQLPSGYVAEPRVHMGSQVEIDVATYEKDDFPSSNGNSGGKGGVATAVWAPSKPSLSIEADLIDDDEYGVRIYDAQRGRQLVASIEIASPANEDRPDKRESFVAKCAALLKKGVSVSIVDLVTVRHFNLYADVLTLLGQDDPTLGDPPPTLYAASCRWYRKDKKMMLETWSHKLAIGQPLPTLPLWLRANFAIPLDLEDSYERACSDLWIT